MKFLATLPAVYQNDLMHTILGHPLISAVRYNTGMATPYSAKETISIIYEMCTQYGKELWIDLKGRQLRITHWAYPENGGKIILNHEIEVEVPARVFFRGNEWSNIVIAHGNVIYVDPMPPKAVGAGQSINIHSANLKIIRYLTNEDIEYLKAACELGIFNFMLSFVEEDDDILQVIDLIMKNKKSEDSADIKLLLKIESLKGLEFIKQKDRYFKEQDTFGLIAARDDLFINIGENKAAMLKALEMMINLDPQAICASRIFTGLQYCGEVSLADFSDLELMRRMGYERFMLSDTISQRHFAQAMQAVTDFFSAGE